MNHHRLLDLALRKQRLQYRCAEQRRELARGIAPFKPFLSIAETVRGGMQWIRQHSALSIGVFTALFVARPRIALRWGRRAWLVWQVWRKLGQVTPPEKYPAFLKGHGRAGN